MNTTPPTDPFPEELTDIDREVEVMRRFGILNAGLSRVPDQIADLAALDRKIEEMRRDNPEEALFSSASPPIQGHCAIQGESPLDGVDMTFDWRQHTDGSISNFRVTRGVTRYPEPPLPARWKRLLARLLLGDGWVRFRFTLLRRIR